MIVEGARRISADGSERTEDVRIGDGGERSDGRGRLGAAGAVAFSDDGDPVDDARLFRSALEYAHAARRPVMEHVQDRALSGRGVMHEGAVSAALGLPGVPAAA